MSKITEHICDGCGGRASAVIDRGGRTVALPADWRRLHVTHGTRSWRLDICSPRCAAKAIDGTYEDEDRREAARHGLRAL